MSTDDIVAWIEYLTAFGFALLWGWVVLVPGLKHMNKDTNDDDDEFHSGD